MSLTTLQLAERCAEAARNPPAGETPAEAVLMTLHRHRSWFCRVDDRSGETVFTKMPVPRKRPAPPVGPADTPLPFEEPPPP